MIVTYQINKNTFSEVKRHSRFLLIFKCKKFSVFQIYSNQENKLKQDQEKNFEFAKLFERKGKKTIFNLSA